MNVAPLTGAALAGAIDDLARLRLTVFRDWPYLYDGTLEYERGYVRPYLDSDRAVVVVARDAGQIVGAATGAPLADHAADFADALAGTDIDIGQTFYCGESVLLPAHRGQGIGHRFFDLREAHARALGLRHICFCAVIRPGDHPLRPEGYRPLDPFWRARGYAPLPGVIARFAWKDVDQPAETEKPLQFWMRTL